VDYTLPMTAHKCLTQALDNWQVAGVFEKTDLAKYLMVWQDAPEIVCRGAQKNFAEFAKRTGAEWSKQEDSFNELFYRHAIAKAIIFEKTGRLVTDQPWYDGGYRAQIVAYTIAKLSSYAGGTG
jgi:hypothetical protein